MDTSMTLALLFVAGFALINADKCDMSKIAKCQQIVEETSKDMTGKENPSVKDMCKVATSTYNCYKDAVKGCQLDDMTKMLETMKKQTEGCDGNGAAGAAGIKSSMVLIISTLLALPAFVLGRL